MRKLALLLALLVLPLRPAHATRVAVTGTLTDATGTGINGTMVLQLAVQATDTTTNTLIVPVPITYRLVNGVVTGTATINDTTNMQPQGDFYKGFVYDTRGTPLATYFFAVPPGAPLNVGQLIPTTVTTSNVMYVTPATVNANSNFTVLQSFNAGLTSGKINGMFTVDGTEYATLNAAFTACNASPGCYLTIPPGIYNFSTQIAPTFPANIMGSGAAYDNAGSHCTTTLQWTGTGIPISVSGTAASGSRVGNFCLFAITGASAVPVLVDVDSAASHTSVINIVADYNTTTGKVEPTVAAFRWGNTGNVVDSSCHDLFARNTPIAYQILNVQALWAGDHCRAVSGTNTTGPEWQIGGAGALAQAIICNSCGFGGGDTSPGVVSVQVLNASGVQLNNGEWECGNAAAAYCLDIPTTATLAQGISVSGGSIFGVNLGGTALSAVFHTQLAGAQFSANNLFIGGTNFTGSPNLVKDDTCSSITTSGIMSVVGSLTQVSSNSSCVVSDMGSNYNGQVNTQSGSGQIILNGGPSSPQNVNIIGIAVASLPAAAAGNKGQIREVTDSTAIAAEGQTCAGGGAVQALAFSNGTVWKCF